MTLWTEPHRAGSFWQRAGLAALAVGLGGGLGWAMAQGQTLLGLLAALLLLVTVVLARRPAWLTVVLLFGIYLNLPAVAVQVHGAPAIVAPAFILLLGVPLAVQTLRREPLIFDRFFFWMLLFLVVQAISAVFAFDTAVAIGEVMNYALEGMALYFLVLNLVRNEAQLRRVVWAIALAAALLGAIALWQEVTQTYENNYWGLAQRKGSFETEQEGDWRDRVAGPLNEPNFFAQMLVLAAPLALFRARGERHPALQLAALLAAALIIIGVVLTFSRGGMLALSATLVATAYLWRMRPWQIALAGALLIGVVLLVAPTTISRLQSIAQTQALVQDDSGGPEDKSIEGRYVENMAAIYMFLDHPVIGVGPGNYRELYVSYAEPIGGYVRYYGRPAHNLYLSFAAELGLIGLSIFLIMLGLQLRDLLHLRRVYRHNRHDIVNLALGLAVGLLGYLVAGLFLHLAYQRYFWIAMALASAAVRIAMQEYQAQALRAVSTPSTAAPGPLAVDRGGSQP